MRLERVEERRGDEPYVLVFGVPLKRDDSNSNYDKNPQIMQIIVNSTQPNLKKPYWTLY